MSLSGELIGHVEISSCGDVLHDLIRHRPHDLPAIRPDVLHGCDLLSGERGAVGSTICWNYIHDGKMVTSKDIIEAIDETNHKIVFKVIGGHLLEIYKAFTIIFHVEPKGGGKQVATWTFEFEKPNTSTPYPTSLMDLMCDILKDMAAHAAIATTK